MKPLRIQAGVWLLALVTAAVLAGAVASAPAWAQDGRARLAADLKLNAIAFFKNSEIPEQDQERTAQCLADAMAADVPIEDAARLADIFEKRAAADKALVVKWLTIKQEDAPARHEQVLARVKKKCPDLEPYLERVM